MIYFTIFYQFLVVFPLSIQWVTFMIYDGMNETFGPLSLPKNEIQTLKI